MSITATETMTEVTPPATENRWPMPGARWENVVRPSRKNDVERLRGTVKIEYTLARLPLADQVPIEGVRTGP